MKFWLFILGLLLLIGAVAGFFLSRVHTNSVLSSQEKEKALENILGRSPVLDTKTPDTSTKLFKGKYLQIQYPANAKIYSSSQDKDIFSFGTDEHIMVSIGVIPTDNKLSEYGAVAMRQEQKDIYVQNSITFQGISCVSFLKTREGVEQSLFCLKNGRLLSFVVTGSDIESVRQNFDKFTQSLAF